MKAEIIAVGTEILTGQIVNTNAQFLSEKLVLLPSYEKIINNLEKMNSKDKKKEKEYER